MERHVLAKAQRSLRPELYARITEKLVFNRLRYDVQLEIACLHISHREFQHAVRALDYGKNLTDAHGKRDRALVQIDCDLPKRRVFKAHLG